MLAPYQRQSTTHIDKYLDFTSHHPLSHKLVVMTSYNHETKHTTILLITRQLRKIAWVTSKISHFTGEFYSRLNGVQMLKKFVQVVTANSYAAMVTDIGDPMALPNDCW